MPSDADYENLRLFSSYSPAEVVLRYAYSSGGKPQPPTKPEHKDFDSAIGFVDVSGFTALSEKLNQDHGRKGAELLNQCASLSHSCAIPLSHSPNPFGDCAHLARHRYINTYFKELIDIIFVHGGDVIKFAGDAMQVHAPPCA